MSNPLAKKEVLHEVLGREIKSVRFKEHARTGKSNAAIRELHQGGQDLAVIEDDEDGRGIWIDRRVLVPWANVLWIEYKN